MGHLFNVDKLHYNQNTFTGLERSNFTIFLPQKMFQKHLRKLKIIKAQAVLELVVNALTHRPTLLGKNIRKKKIQSNPIVYWERNYVNIWSE